MTYRSTNLIRLLLVLCFVGAYIDMAVADDAGQIGKIKGSGVIERGMDVVVGAKDVAVTKYGYCGNRSRHNAN